MSNMYQLLSQSQPRSRARSCLGKQRKSCATPRDGGADFPRTISLLDTKKRSIRTERTDDESSAADDTTVSMLEIPFVLKDGVSSSKPPPPSTAGPAWGFSLAGTEVDEEMPVDDSYFNERIGRATRRTTKIVSNANKSKRELDPLEISRHDIDLQTRTVKERREEIARLRARVKDRLKVLAEGGTDDDGSSIPSYDDERSGLYFDLHLERNQPSRFERQRQNFRQIDWHER